MTIIEQLIQDAKTAPKTLVYKLRHGMEITEAELEEVYNSNNPYLAYFCARDIPGANIKKLEKAVLSFPYYSTLLDLFPKQI